MKIERKPRPSIYAWLNEDYNWERAEWESFAQIAREVGISAGALAHNLRVILYQEIGFRSFRSVDQYREEKKRLRRERIADEKRRTRDRSYFEGG